MSKIKLPYVTLLGIDCVDVERLIKAMNISQEGIEFGAVKLLTSLPTNNNHLVKIPHIGTIEDLSKFCILELNKYVETDYALLIQYDGFVLNPDSWNSEFLKYDYIGAPISKKDSWVKTDLQYPLLVVGNGGFSIRSKKFLELSARLANENKITKFHPEDVSLCVWYRDLFEQENMTFAPVDLAIKFSVQEDYGQYEKPFGFHGCYGKNMDELKSKYPNFPFYYFLSKVIGKRLEKIKQVFESVALEAHLHGSLARDDSDNFSDVDIWITFKDEDFQSALKNRFDLYSQIGEIVHIVEPPQNAPIDGIQSNVLYKTKVGLFIVDYSLCPHATSFILQDSKKLFGNIDLPNGKLGLNPKKITVDENYRLDFFISFIFGTIKKIVRYDIEPLNGVFREYDNLVNKYGFKLKDVDIKDHSFNNLKKISSNIYEIANEKQKNAITEIGNFLKLVEENMK
ncbi:MAG: nucleotidyltransferase domain-containing protein [Candidatus Pacebacteria bacterium]|nr:nucleotidyltransferase domain-containing protein [Candidatus Paceibacterota bacterium]